MFKILLTNTFVWFILILLEGVVVMTNTLKEYKGLIIFYLIVLIIIVAIGFRSKQIDNYSKNINIITTLA